jgi:hypothetical protein
MMKSRAPKKNVAKPPRFNVRAWFAELDRFKTELFVAKDSKKQRAPRRTIFK